MTKARPVPRALPWADLWLPLRGDGQYGRYRCDAGDRGRGRECQKFGATDNTADTVATASVFVGNRPSTLEIGPIKLTPMPPAPPSQGGGKKALRSPGRRNKNVRNARLAQAWFFISPDRAHARRRGPGQKHHRGKRRIGHRPALHYSLENRRHLGEPGKWDSSDIKMPFVTSRRFSMSGPWRG
jgi:hypothetical protein